MHFTKNARKNAGFTLVELIVVITILAILATIGFISYQKYTTQSRNTVRETDLGNIKQMISTDLAKGGSPKLFAINTGSSLTGSEAPSVSGFTGTALVLNTDYGAGDVNYAAFGQSNSSMRDPDRKNAAGEAESYKIGWTTKRGRLFELAATISGDQPQALITGTYAHRNTEIGTASSGVTVTVQNKADKKFTVDSAKAVIFALGDIVQFTDAGSHTFTGKVLANRVGDDGTNTITLDTIHSALVATNPGTFKLPYDETLGLIASHTGETVSDIGKPITNLSLNRLPY